MRDILRQMGEGSIDINALAQDLDINRSTLDAILEMAVREGYVERVDVSSDCGGCPLSNKCRIERSGCDKTKIYILTPEGEEYVG